MAVQSGATATYRLAWLPARWNFRRFPFVCGPQRDRWNLTGPSDPHLTHANCAHCVRHAPRQAGRALVKLYRYTFSPLIGFHCRHLPTCSDYADEALSRFGLWAGGWMTLARLLRCHPWGTSGLDFVPREWPRRARWWAPWRYARWRGTNETAE